MLKDKVIVADYLKQKTDTLKTSHQGDHYKGMTIEPIQYIEANRLGFHEGAVVKYVSRWRVKNGLDDLKKARFFIDRMIELIEAGVEF